MSFVLGLKGDVTDTLTWDLSGRYAENEVEYTLSDTINPSLGRLSPLSFTPGTLTQEESGINLDFVQSFQNSPLNVAFGAEFRNETYKIEAGDEASVVPGPDGGDLRRRLRRLPGVHARVGGQLRERQLGGLCRRRDRSDRSPVGRRRAALRGLRRVRRHDRLEGLGALPVHRYLRDPCHGEYRFPRPDAGAGQYAQRYDDLGLERQPDPERHVSRQ